MVAKKRVTFQTQPIRAIKARMPMHFPCHDALVASLDSNDCVISLLREMRVEDGSTLRALPAPTLSGAAIQESLSSAHGFTGTARTVVEVSEDAHDLRLKGSPRGIVEDFGEGMDL